MSVDFQGSRFGRDSGWFFSYFFPLFPSSSTLFLFLEGIQMRGGNGFVRGLGTYLGCLIRDPLVVGGGGGSFGVSL